MMGNILFAALALFVGFCFPVMAASNGILGKSLGSPFIATLAIFQLGSILLLMIILVTRTPIPHIRQLQQIDWKTWAGGCIVILNLITFTIVPGKIGIANMIALFITGQLLAAVLAEHFGLLRFPVHPVNWQRIAGVILLITGVVLIKKF